MAEGRRRWIEDVELPNVQVKWNWSHFDGRGEGLNQPGDHNFTIVLPEAQALELRELGWENVKYHDPYEEGDDPEYTMKIKISYRFEAPKVWFIKDGRKIRADESDLADIRRDSVQQIDVVISPSPWTQPGGNSGITSYATELYVQIKQSRFEKQYEDLSPIESI